MTMKYVTYLENCLSYNVSPFLLYQYLRDIGESMLEVNIKRLSRAIAEDHPKTETLVYMRRLYYKELIYRRESYREHGYLDLAKEVTDTIEDLLAYKPLECQQIQFIR
jgi:hypothetical protein